MSRSHVTPTPLLDVQLRQSKPFPLDVSLSCKAGELLALVGPSGSGKTTVLRSIAGLHSVEKGHISCTDQVWLDTKTNVDIAVQSRGVGLVFQHYGLFPNKSALENVSLAVPRHHSRKQRKQIALSWLERTNMTGLEQRKPDALSGGQKQRVALARALARNPSVLLLDEPFSAVDQQTRRRLYHELAKLRTGLEIPMLLVTHDINEVQELADSLCLIHRGQTLQLGNVQSVMNAPASKAVAKLLGHQNLFAARVTAHTDESTVYQLGDEEQLHGPRVQLPLNSLVTLLIAPTAITPVVDKTQNEIAGPTQNNCLRGCIRDAVGMGDEWSLRVHLDTVTKSLRFRVPAHAYDYNSMHAGTAICVNIRPSGIQAISGG